MDALFQSRRWSEGFQLKQLPSTYVDKIKISFDREFQAAKFRHSSASTSSPGARITRISAISGLILGFTQTSCSTV